MYVVGAKLLSDFWESHTCAEGELRALHALLSNLDASSLVEALGHIARFDGTTAEVSLRTARVRLEISAAAGVARYAAVEVQEEVP